MHQQAALPQRVLVENIAFFIGADVHPNDRHLSVLDVAEGVLQIHMALADGFDLGAGQFDAGLIFFLNEVVVVRLAVFRHDLDTLAQVRHLPLAVCRILPLSGAPG